MIEKILIFYAGVAFGWFIVSLLSASDTEDEKRQLEQDIDDMIRESNKKQDAVDWLRREGL